MITNHQHSLPGQRMKRIGDNSFERQKPSTMAPGSDAGAQRWAIASTLIQPCKLNGVELLTSLTDVLQRIVSGQTKSHQLHALLPWNWRPPATIVAA